MSDPSRSSAKETPDKFVLTFTNGALAKLQELAQEFGVPQERLGDVVAKGLKILDLSKNGKIIIDKTTEKLEVDIKKL
ncbi:hypothetical protein C5B42_03090 [Candidatus Cerribacteria bacterium 'Amazon FNV 2010 28 9']|uniref:Uncharacterized protein n=1 Tax=Candidatus Cerribacteria bacterium 'Amazon FNV 2010 28 9' TaxID=2081795 RepID=A0A317JNQ4_9BACT|nr:MAG: hypothetical protein C5B42_03090 [Candidatus Cerribacteria bacterium 'Amazon FNV 2010 28 9']